MGTTDPPENSRLTETDIHAYADGVLPAERTERLRRYLGNRSDEARRVDFYSSLNAQLKRAFQPTDEPVLARAIHASGWRAAPKRLNSRNECRTALRAFIVLVFALAAASGWIVASQPSDEAFSNAAVMALVRASSGDHNTAPSVHLSGYDDAAPDLTSAGLRVTGTRTLSLGPISRVSEFIYLNTAGQPVVLLVGRALTAQAQPQWVAHRVGTIRLLTWVTRHERYVLAGDVDTRGLMRAADVTTLR